MAIILFDFLSSEGPGASRRPGLGFPEHARQNPISLCHKAGTREEIWEVPNLERQYLDRIAGTRAENWLYPLLACSSYWYQLQIFEKN